MVQPFRDALDSVHATEELKASTLAYLKAERLRQGNATRPARPSRHRVIAAACAALALVLALGVGAWTQLLQAVSYISVDVNPSVELCLNRQNRVLSATAYNPDGQAILQGLSLGGMTYTQAVSELVKSASECDFLNEQADLTFTVATGNPQTDTALTQGIRQVACAGAYKALYETAPLDAVSEAHSCGLSLGKYKAYRELAAYDDTVTADACRDMTMAQIHQQIAQHCAETQHRPAAANAAESCPAASQEPHASQNAQDSQNAHGNQNDHAAQGDHGNHGANHNKTTG